MNSKEQKLIIDPVTSPLVLEAFTRYADGETLRAIVESFNERGFLIKKQRSEKAQRLKKRQFAEVEKGSENLLDAIPQGLLNTSVKKRMNQLEAQKKN